MNILTWINKLRLLYLAKKKRKLSFFLKLRRKMDNDFCVKIPEQTDAYKGKYKGQVHIRLILIENLIFCTKN